MTYTSNRFLTPEACDAAIGLLETARDQLPLTREDYIIKRRIALGVCSPYICDNLSISVVSNQLREWIQEIIGYSVFEYFRLNQDIDTQFRKAQVIRKQLIEWMIIELEAKKKHLKETK